MKTAFFSIALVVLALLSAPCLAEDRQDISPEGQAVQQPDSTVTASADEEQTSVTCANCGKTFYVGRHGQTAGETMKCPYCGKEICPTEEKKGVCFGADAAFLSKYVYRGLMTTNGPVFQPNLWVSYSGFTVSAWGNLDMTDINGFKGNINEMDYTLDYSGSIGKLNYSAGAVYYNFPHTEVKDTSEAYVGVGYDVILQPKLVVYYDFWQVDGFYGAFSIGHGFELPEVLGLKSSFDLSAQVGLASKNYNRNTFGADHTTFTDMMYSASLPVTITDNFTVKPTVCYSSVLDRTIRSKNEHNDNFVWGGVLSASF